MTATTSATSDVSTVPTIIARPPKGPVGDCQPSPPSSVPAWWAKSGSEFQTIVPMKPTLTAANTKLATIKR